MMDSIGWKAGGVTRIAASTPVVPVANTTTTTTADTPAAAAPAGAAASLAKSLSASAPVDTDRVAQIRKAIADGRFPLVPSTIADRLIALKLEWNPNDKA